MSFVIDTDSVSESEILEDLNNFLNTRPDAARWSVFFESQIGQTQLKYFQGLASFFSIKAILGRREAFPLYAQNRSSVVGGSQFQGYSAFRGRNATMTLTVVPNFTGTIFSFDVVGAISSAEIVSLETKVVNEGVPVTLKVIVGNKLESILTAQSDSASFFRFEGNGMVSDDVRVLVEGVEASISSNILDVRDNKFFVQTNAVGSVDVFSQNNISAPVRFDANDEIKLEYIELKDVIFEDDEIEFDFGTISNIQRDTIYKSPEDIDAIRFNAPLQNQVRDVIRAREDQPKQLILVDETIIDATGEDVSAAVMRLFYLRLNRILFTEAQKTSLVNQWDKYRPHGIKPPIIADPTRKPLIIKVDATLENVVGTPEDDVRAILDELEDDLEVTINLVDLEKAIENLSTIKIARPVFDGVTWEASSKYEIGQHVKPTADNGKIYQVSELLYFSDSSEPIWPTSEAGETIIDGDILWKSIPKNDTAGFTTWQADTPYKTGDQVKPSVSNGFIFEVVETINKSGNSEPVWPVLGSQTPDELLGSLVDDGDIKWIARPIQGSPSSWQANTQYRKGDVIVATDPSSSDTEGVMFQAFAYLGTSDSSEPTFPTSNGSTVDDNNIRFETQSPDQIELESGKDSYFTITLDFNAT